MRIGIVGTGNMGRAIGVRLTHLGHEVLFGARDPAQAEEAVARAGGTALAGTNDEAAHGEVVVWTVRDVEPSAVLADPALLAGKTVININNRDYAHDVMSGAWFGESIAEQFQSRAPQARVVKALNVIAMETLDTSPGALRTAGAQVFLAGDDARAKATVSGLMCDLGFEAVDLGAGPVAMRAAEALGDVIRLIMIDGKVGGQANLQLNMLPAPDLHSIGAREESAYG